MNRFRKTLRSTQAAIDLASIMVGIIVIGIIGGVIGATVFAVIPWAQDNAAKAELDAVKQAQNVYAGFAATGNNASGLTSGPELAFINPFATLPTSTAAEADGKVVYGTYKQLVDRGLIDYSKRMAVTPNGPADCFTGIVLSESGKIFWTDSTLNDVKRYVSSSTSTCTDLTANLPEALKENAEAGGGVATPPVATTPPATTPPTVEPATPAVDPTVFQASAVSRSTTSSSYFAISNGKLYGWGQNNAGQVSSKLGNVTVDSPKLVSDLAFVDVQSSNTYTLALTSSGDVYQWGQVNSYNSSASVPTKVAGLSQIKQIAVGGSHALALNDRGTVYGWGSNQYGQNGTETNTVIPTQIVAGYGTATSIAAGPDFSILSNSAGAAYAWGNPANGQLGNATTSGNVTRPQLVYGVAAGVTKVFSAGSTSFALTTRGAVYAWGINSSSEFGNGNTTASLRAVEVPSLYQKGIVNIVGQGAVQFAFADDGTSYSWGVNTTGFLGDGTKISKTTPQIAKVNGRNIKSVSLGNFGTSFLTDDGNMFVSGIIGPNNGNLGLGTSYQPTNSTKVYTPIQLKFIP